MITKAMWKVILLSAILVAMTMINLPDDGNKLDAPDLDKLEHMLQ